MNDNEKKLFQRLGEDTAYTFKGLYKKSDLLEFKYRLYLSIPIIFSIVSLGFDQEIPGYYLKGIAVASLVFTMFALIEQKNFEKSSSYRSVADDVKILYDRAEALYLQDKFDAYNELQLKWENLRRELSDFPIGGYAYWRTTKTIKTEMNLAWLGGEYS
jgi:hypothetical protein